jgi:hypothetical protein
MAVMAFLRAVIPWGSVHFLEITQMNEVSLIEFYEDKIPAITKDGEMYVVMRHITDALGLDWSAQRKRIMRDDVLNEGVVIMAIPSAGGNQDAVMLPVKYLNGWLFGVQVNKVKPELRSKLIKYKRECYQVLHDHWLQQNYSLSDLIDITSLEFKTLSGTASGSASFLSNWGHHIKPALLAKLDRLQKLAQRELPLLD